MKDEEKSSLDLFDVISEEDADDGTAIENTALKKSKKGLSDAEAALTLKSEEGDGLSPLDEAAEGNPSAVRAEIHELLLYDSEDEGNESEDGVDKDEYANMLAEYKSSIAKVFSSAKKEEPLEEEDEKEPPVLVKHKEIDLGESKNEPVDTLEQIFEETTEAEETEALDEEEEPNGKEEPSESISEEEEKLPEDENEEGEQLEFDLGAASSLLNEGDPSENDEDGASDEDAEPEKKKNRFVDSLFDIVELFIFTLTAVLFITNFAFRHSRVVGDSMMNTLNNNDHLIISSMFYTPERGDVVVFNIDGQALVKRVVAIEGDRVDFYYDKGNYRLFVNGKEMDEDYVFIDGIGNGDIEMTHDVHNHIVGKGKVFVLGDHRNNSKDSRYTDIGDVDVNQILGKVVFRFYPFSDMEVIK